MSPVEAPPLAKMEMPICSFYGGTACWNHQARVFIASPVRAVGEHVDVELAVALPVALVPEALFFGSASIGESCTANTDLLFHSTVTPPEVDSIQLTHDLGSAADLQLTLTATSSRFWRLKGELMPYIGKVIHGEIHLLTFRGCNLRMEIACSGQRRGTR